MTEALYSKKERGKSEFLYKLAPAVVKYLPRGVCGTVHIIKTSKASNGKFIYQLFYIMYIYVFHDITMRDASSVWLWCFEFFISVLRVIPLGIMRQI